MTRKDRRTMNSKTLSRLLLAVISAVAFMLCFGIAYRAGRGQEPAPTADEAPATSSVLRSIPFDRITLVDGTVLIVDPVSPRPLPVIDPAKAKKQEKARRQQERASQQTSEEADQPAPPSASNNGR